MSRVFPLVSVEMAKAAAEFAAECLHHVHKGVIDCGDKIVVFANGDWPDLPERVTHFLRESGIAETVEVCRDTDGYSLAIVASNFRQHPVNLDRLNELLWEQEEAFYRAAQMVPVMSYRR